VSAAASTRLAAAVIVATIAFVAYSRTLLPGVDLGDTGGFQAAVVWPRIDPRQAYPLYYGAARPFVEHLSPDNPARGLNLFSAVAGAAAVGLLTWVAAGIGGSLAAGIAAGLLLAFSYTYWTQAIIAEVYTLHLAMMGLCLAALGAYARRPSTARLAIFCGVYALGFGNHLSMILLLVPCAAFVLLAHPRPREVFTPRIAAMALLIAAAGALQYTPNLLAVWSAPDAPAGSLDKLAAFWFDTTKADWRATMVLGVDPASAFDRLAMWGWDARQQFGVAGLAAAGVGAIRLWWISRPWAVLVWLAYACCTLFALTYNVGDAHVFFLPGHMLTALAAGVAIGRGPQQAFGHGTAAARRLAGPAMTAAAVGLVAYAGWRGWSTWPAADRQSDRRGEAFVERLLLGVDERQALLISNLAWDQENALLYATRVTHRDVAWVRLFDVMPHLPFLVRDNMAIGRDIVLTAGAAAAVVAAYGDAFPLAVDEVPAAPRLSDVVARLPRGTPYVMTMLEASRENDPGAQVGAAAVTAVTAGTTAPAEPVAYEVLAGTLGDRPVLHRRSNRPFRVDATVAGEALTIRMDAWLPQDTFRRGGFGHVLRGRERVLFVERGISLAWFEGGGGVEVFYESNPYAPQPRLRIPAGVARLARGSIPAGDAIVETCRPAGRC
jgi:hypothetical protein